MACVNGMVELGYEKDSIYDDAVDFGTPSIGKSCNVEKISEDEGRNMSDHVPGRHLSGGESCEQIYKAAKRSSFGTMIQCQHHDQNNGTDLNRNKVFCLKFRRDFLAEEAFITDIGYALEDQYGTTVQVMDIENRTRGWRIWVKGQWMKEQLIKNGLLIKNRLYHLEEVS